MVKARIGGVNGPEIAIQKIPARFGPFLGSAPAVEVWASGSRYGQQEQDMADGWFIQRDARRYGPYSSAQMVEMAKKGQVLPLDWVARGENGQWMPASQAEGLFAAPTPGTVAPPQFPVAGSPSSPDDAFAFDVKPVPDDDGAASHASRRKRAAIRLSKPFLAAIAGSLLLVILIVGYLATRNRSKQDPATGGNDVRRKTEAAGKGGFTPALMDKAVEGNGMPITELLAQVPPPVYSCRHRQNPSVQEHVWKAGENSYVLVNVRDNRVQRIQEGMKQIYFENLKKANAKYYDTYTP
jgi:hypothetical protein